MRTVSLPKEVIKEFPEAKDTVRKLMYIRTPEDKSPRGKPVGIILVTTDGYVGWSLKGMKDTEALGASWNKTDAFRRAWNRATKAKLTLENRLTFFEKESKDEWKTNAQLLYKQLKWFSDSLIQDEKPKA
jgi:hypothetical protein